MAVYRPVYLNFWTDPKVDEAFTPEDKYFYLYLLTNPHTNSCGCYEVSLRQMSRETGYNDDSIIRLMNRMSNEHDVIRYDGETNEVLIIRWSKYNWTTSEKLLKNIIEKASEIKSEAFKTQVFTLVEWFKQGKNSDTLCIPYAYPMHTVSIPYPYGIEHPTYINTNNLDTKEKDLYISSNENFKEIKNKDKVLSLSKENILPDGNISKKSSPFRFSPPSLQDVESYCKERQNSVDAERFFDFYESKGWMVGKNKMKDWKAAVRTWERNSSGNGSSGAKQGETKSIAEEWLNGRKDLC